MLFGLTSRRQQPPADLTAQAAPARQSGWASLTRSVADAWSAIHASRTAVEAGQRDERLSLHPLAARPVTNQRVDVLFGEHTGRTGHSAAAARVVGHAPGVGIPTMPARAPAAGLRGFMPRPLD